MAEIWIFEVVEVLLWDTVASDSPEVFNADLAKSLYNLSLSFRDGGKKKEAPAAILEAVKMRRDQSSGQRRVQLECKLERYQVEQ